MNLFIRMSFLDLVVITGTTFPAWMTLLGRVFPPEKACHRDAISHLNMIHWLKKDFFFKGKYILLNESSIHSILFIECMSSSFIFILLNASLYLQITALYSLRSGRVCWSKFHFLLKLNKSFERKDRISPPVFISFLRYEIYFMFFFLPCHFLILK